MPMLEKPNLKYSTVVRLYNVTAPTMCQVVLEIKENGIVELAVVYERLILALTVQHPDIAVGPNPCFAAYAELIVADTCRLCGDGNDSSPIFAELNAVISGPNRQGLALAAQPLAA